MPKLQGCLEKELDLLYPVKVGDKEITKVTIRELTGYDEEELSQDQYRTNPPLYLKRLVWRCIVKVDGTDNLLMEHMNSFMVPDTDRILLEIRLLSSGKELDVNYRCACGNKGKAIVDLTSFEFKDNDKKAIEIPFVLKRPYTKVLKDTKEIYEKGVVRVATDGAFQEEVYEKFGKKNNQNAGQLRTYILSKLVKFENAQPLNEDDIRKMTKGQREQLTKIIEENRVGYNFDDTVNCGKCRAPVDLSVSPTDFFV